MLTRDMILQAQDFEKEEVDIPEWGGSVFIRSMTVAASDVIQLLFIRLGGGELAANQNGSIRDPDALKGLKVAMVSRCLCDEKGELIFNDNEGRAILETKSNVVMDRLYDVAMRINKMGDDEVEQEKKDLPATDSTDSNLFSAPPSAAH